MHPYETLLRVLSGLNAAVFVLDAERQIMLMNEAAITHFAPDLEGVDFA